MWRGCEGGSFEDEWTITPRAPPEKERIKRSLSEIEKALSFLVKIFREGCFKKNIEEQDKCIIV